MKNITKIFAVFFVIFFALASSANAHFNFVYPLPRGLGGNITQAPCGGFNSVNTSAITSFPAKGGIAKTSFGHGEGVTTFFYARTSNGTFKPVSGKFIIDVPEGKGPVIFNTTIDLTKAKAKRKEQGVLQAVYRSNDGNTTWYGCCDIKVTT